MSYEIDYPGGAVTKHETLDKAVQRAQEFLATHDTTRSLRVFHNDKAVAMITPTIVQTLDTDKGF